MDCKLQNFELKCYLPIARARRIWRFWLEKHRLKGLQHSNSVCENAICQQKSVEEVDVEETQVCQPLKQPFWRGISNLRNLQRKLKEIEYNIFQSEENVSVSDLASIEGFGKSDIHVIFEQIRITFHTLR